MWNAWIFIIPLLVMHVVDNFVLKARGGRAQEGKILIILFLILLILPIFIPLKLDVIWLCIGLFLYLRGIIFLILAVYGFASTHKDKLVTNGIFSISRNLNIYLYNIKADSVIIGELTIVNFIN